MEWLKILAGGAEKKQKPKINKQIKVANWYMASGFPKRLKSPQFKSVRSLLCARVTIQFQRKCPFIYIPDTIVLCFVQKQKKK